MPKPRYDEDENKSRHAAADPDCCEEMAEKYGWQLVDVEKTGNPILEVDASQTQQRFAIASRCPDPRLFQKVGDLIGELILKEVLHAQPVC